MWSGNSRSFFCMLKSNPLPYPWSVLKRTCYYIPTNIPDVYSFPMHPPSMFPIFPNTESQSQNSCWNVICCSHVNFQSVFLLSNILSTAGGFENLSKNGSETGVLNYWFHLDWAKKKITTDNPDSVLTCLPIFPKEFSLLLITSTCNNR